jgi:endonuclease/exonuclease/phosphatase (EEP) superfamily protein YafD
MIRQHISESIQWIIVGFIITMSLLFLFPPDYLLAKQFSGFAIHWMISCLIIGILALFFGNEKFLYTGFICCGIVAFYLMNSFNTDLRLANFNNTNAITVLFVNLTLGDDDQEKTLSAIYQNDADVIIVEELTPDRVELLQRIKARYPYQLLLPRADPLGKAVLSKIDFQSKTMFDIYSIPVLRLVLLNESKDSFNLLVSNCLPPITMNSYQNVNLFLDSFANMIHLDFTGTILAANFNLVPWSRELRNFRLKAGLISSRRDNTEGIPNGNALLNAPNNEIFYSKDLECSMLHIINDSRSHPLGLYGRYQKKKIETRINN